MVDLCPAQGLMQFGPDLSEKYYYVGVGPPVNGREIVRNGQ